MACRGALGVPNNVDHAYHLSPPHTTNGFDRLPVEGVMRCFRIFFVFDESELHRTTAVVTHLDKE